MPPFQCRLEAKKLRKQSVTGRSETEVLNKLVHRSFFFSLNVKDNARKHTWIEVEPILAKTGRKEKEIILNISMWSAANCCLLMEIFVTENAIQSKVA